MNKKTLIANIQNSLLNARELFKEAQLLKTNNMFARAYSLFHLSMEEIGKSFVTIKYILIDDYSEEKIKKIDKELTNHKIKIDLSSNIEVITVWLFDGDIDLETIEKITFTKEQIETMNKFKNLSLYSFIENGISYKPSDIFDEKTLNNFEERIELKLLAAEQFFEVLLKDIEKYIKVVKKINND